MLEFFEAFGGIGLAFLGAALAVGLCLAAGGLLFRHSDPAQDRSALAVVRPAH